jgi:hypothetical protein
VVKGKACDLWCVTSCEIREILKIRGQRLVSSRVRAGSDFGARFAKSSRFVVRASEPDEFPEGEEPLTNPPLPPMPAATPSALPSPL